MARTSLLKLRDDLTKYNASNYPGIAFIAPLVVTDDPVQNGITVKEFYQITAEALRQSGLLEDFGFGVPRSRVHFLTRWGVCGECR